MQYMHTTAAVPCLLALVSVCVTIAFCVLQNLEGMFTQLGQVHKMEIEEGTYIHNHYMHAC